MWIRNGNVWHWDTVPELEVRPCRMDNHATWWTCWFEGRPCIAVGASASSADVKAEAYEYFLGRIDL